LEGEGVSPGLVALLADAEVVLLGYHVVPEQTPPAQARLSFEERAAGKLDEIEAALVEAGARVERTLVFTPDADQTIERLATEEGCAAVAYVNPVNAADRVLVVLHGDVDAGRIGTVTAGLVAGRGIDVGVLEVVEPGTETGLTDRALAALSAGGVDRSRVHEMAMATAAPVQEITRVADDFDATVLGERESTLRALLFGEFDERVIAESLGPVVVVRRVEDDGES
jgi:nucleotide-binding universal stress UspA family protein